MSIRSIIAQQPEACALVEKNPLVGIFNNVFGTLEVAQAALNTDVERMVSSRPTRLYDRRM